MKKKKDKEPTCGQCGYFMRYVDYKGEPDNDGDCASIGINNCV